MHEGFLDVMIFIVEIFIGIGLFCLLTGIGIVAVKKFYEMFIDDF